MPDVQANLAALAANPYPGRGIVMGRSAGGDQLLLAYWLMGRSNNSRNRELLQVGDSVRTVPHDPSQVEDPSLIIYNAMAVFEREGVWFHIATNGDQTDTILEYLRSGRSVEQALRSRSFEPDLPNYTPRISGVIRSDGWAGMTWTTSRDPSTGEANHRWFDCDFAARGVGWCTHTYRGDGDPLPSFRGAPYPVPVGADAEDTAQLLWNHLDRSNRVAIVVKGIDVHTGDISYSIINQLGSQA